MAIYVVLNIDEAPAGGATTSHLRLVGIHSSLLRHRSPALQNLLVRGGRLSGPSACGGRPRWGRKFLHTNDLAGLTLHTGTGVGAEVSQAKRKGGLQVGVGAFVSVREPS